MSQQDPTSIAATTGDECWFGEMSVDDIAALEALEIGTSRSNPASQWQDRDHGDNSWRLTGTPSRPQRTCYPNPNPDHNRNAAGKRRYRGTLGAFQLELRVDVDRTRPMKRLSGDFYQVSGGTTTYSGSFVVNSPTITVTSTQVLVKGLGSFTFAAGFPVVQVTIPRRTILQPQAPATLQFFTTGGSPGSTYTCAFESIHFRTVRIETDQVSDVTTPVFVSYNTGALPSGGPAPT